MHSFKDLMVDQAVNDTAAEFVRAKIRSVVPGKPRVFLPSIGGTNACRRICDEIAAGSYRGVQVT